MISKKLTTQEAQFLKTIAERILSPLKVRIHIPSAPMIVHTFMGNGNGRMIDEGDEFVYHIVFENEKGARESSFVFYETPLAGWAWLIAFDAFMKIDGNLESSTADNLWPRDNGLLPDYERFLKEK